MDSIARLCLTAAGLLVYNRHVMVVVDWIIKDGYKVSGDIGDYLKRLEMFFTMMYLRTRCTCSHDVLAHMMHLFTGLGTQTWRASKATQREDQNSLYHLSLWAVWEWFTLYTQQQIQLNEITKHQDSTGIVKA